VPKLRKQVFS